MASPDLERALRYLTRSAQPNLAALRTLGEAELRELRAMVRDGGVDFPPNVVRAIDAFILERRAHRRKVERGESVVTAEPALTMRATLRLGASVLGLIASMVGLAVLLVHFNRWP
jgi:hypothetical protein